MKRDLNRILVLSAVLALSGCGDGSSEPAGSGGIGGDAGSGGNGGAAGEGGHDGNPGTPALDALGSTPRYAVVSSDFSSSSIAMLDERFEPVEESWLSSGTTFPGLVATLSGDVVLPSRQAPDGTFTVIDRFLTDVVSRFFVPSGNLVGQVRTHDTAGASGFSSNPQDLLFVSAQSAWVPRYEPNLDPDALAENQGNDLFEIDPTDMTATGERIDLSSLNTTVSVDMPPAPVEVEVFARPSRGLLVGSTLVVGLDRVSAAFDAAGSGMVALVDLDDGSVDGVEIERLASCGRVVPIPGAPTKVAVGCVGFSNPFGDEAQIRASSGIAVLDIEASSAVVERVWRVAADESAAIAVNAVVALDDERMVAVANGDFVDTTDTLYEVDLSDGAQREVHVSDGSFTIGTCAYDAGTEMLFVPDAARNAVIELVADESGFIEVRSVEIAPGLALPPRQVYKLD